MPLKKSVLTKSSHVYWEIVMQCTSMDTKYWTITRSSIQRYCRNQRCLNRLRVLLFLQWQADNHFKVIKHHFIYPGIRADSTALLQNVNKPKEIKENLYPLTLDEIHKIFAYTIEKCRRRYLVLIRSCMQIRECISMR
jgi:hypothetical protein